MRDLANHIAVRRAISPMTATDNTAVVSQIVSLAGFDKMMFAIAVGSVADADTTFTVLVEHGDAANLSDAAAVPDSQLIGTELGAAFKFDSDDQTRKIGYIGPKAFVRMTITPAGNTGAYFLAVLALMSGSRYAPVA